MPGAVRCVPHAARHSPRGACANPVASVGRAPIQRSVRIMRCHDASPPCPHTPRSLPATRYAHPAAFCGMSGRQLSITCAISAAYWGMPGRSFRCLSAVHNTHPAAFWGMPARQLSATVRKPAANCGMPGRQVLTKSKPAAYWGMPGRQLFIAKPCGILGYARSSAPSGCGLRLSAELWRVGRVTCIVVPGVPASDAPRTHRLEPSPA